MSAMRPQLRMWKLRRAALFLLVTGAIIVTIVSQTVAAAAVR